MNLLTVSQFSEKHKAFSQLSLRNYIFHSETNGWITSGVVLWIGRKVLIDEDKFFAWLKKCQPKTKPNQLRKKNSSLKKSTVDFIVNRMQGRFKHDE